MMSYYEPEDVPECASCEQAQKDYAELEREVEQWKKAAEANIEENVRLRREAHTWSKACEAATTKLHKLSTPHPRLEVRYWTGEYWEPLHGALFYAALDALFTVPTTEIQEAEQIYAEELLQAHTRDLERLERFEDWLADRTGPVLSLEEVRDAIAPKPRFQNVSCSQCGRDFGPGDHGFSHCENHK